MRVFCALWESEPRVQQCGSPIGNLCHRHMCAIHRRVHASWLNPHHCYRFSADLTLTRHVLLRPTLMKLSLWRFIRAQSACYRPLGRSCDEWTWRWTLMTTPCPILPFQWGQLLPLCPVVAPFCKIDCFYSAANHLADQFLSVSLNPKPVNSKKKPINT